MLKKVAGYFFLSFFSFLFFTACFHTVANAQGSASGLLAPSKPEPSKQKIPWNPLLADNAPATLPTTTPTPTALPTPTATPTPTDTPTPTPTTVPTDTPTPTPSITDTPTPTPTAAPAPTDIESLFSRYSDQYHVDKTLLKKIAQCESGFNTNSNNAGLYVGMYQFSDTTWKLTRASMGLDQNPDLRTNAEEAIKTAAFKISQGGIGAWPNCN